MSYVIADPQMMTSAASDLAAIASNVSAAHKVAAAPTTSVIPAAADEVSAGIAQLFSQHAHGYQAVAGQAAAFHEQFVQNLSAGAFSYASIEATIAGSLSILATLPPQQLLTVLGVLLTSPVWLPIVGIGLLLVLGYLYFYPPQISMIDGFLAINGMIAL